MAPSDPKLVVDATTRMLRCFFFSGGGVKVVDFFCLLKLHKIINLMNNLALRWGEQRAGGSSCSVSVKGSSLKYVGGLMKGERGCDMMAWPMQNGR